MSSYLNRLRALESEKEPDPEPTKPTEAPLEHETPPFVGFVGSNPATFQNIETPEPLAIHAGNYACDGCRNITMRAEYRADSRRFFWFSCAKGFPIIEAGYRSERVLLAPAACDSFTPSARH